MEKMDSLEEVKKVRIAGKKYIVKRVNYIDTNTNYIVSHDVLIFDGDKPVNKDAFIHVDAKTFTNMEANPLVMKEFLKELKKKTF